MKAFITSSILAISTFAVPALAQIDFSTDFEGATGISKDGWTGVVNYYTDQTCTNYGSTPYAFPAADNDANVSNLVTSAGSQKLNFFSNYGDGEQATNCIETIILQETTITAADVGSYTFSFESEDPGLGATTATAFVKLNFAPIAGTPISALPAGAKSVSVEITADMVGDLLQWGFANTSFNYQPTGMYYDNVSFAVASAGGGGSGSGSGSGMAPPAAIPTLPVWGLFALAGLLGLMGYRRKK